MKEIVVMGARNAPELLRGSGGGEYCFSLRKWHDFIGISMYYE
jgi:hypothetical protein